MTLIPSLLHPAVPQQGASYCWLTEKDSFVYQLCFLHIEMFGALVIGTIFVTRVLSKLSKVSDSVEDASVLVIRSYVLRHKLFLLAFSFVFVIVVVFVTNQILQLVRKEKNIYFRMIISQYFIDINVNDLLTYDFFFILNIIYFFFSSAWNMVRSSSNGVSSFSSNIWFGCGDIVSVESSRVF